jgi:CheY-like chemotaxis protein
MARLLLVEDSEDTRILLSLALAGDGWVVDQAADAFEAEAMLRRGSYDLLLADYDLPGKTGAALIRDAGDAGLLGYARVLVVTAHPDPRGVERLEVIRKPLDLPTFLHQLRNIRDAAVASRGKDAPPPAPPMELVLYVSPLSLASARALEVLRAVVKEAAPAVTLTVCDLAREPAAAERDNVVFTPTLVKRRPGPRTWILGDLSRRETVADLIETFRAGA